MYPKYAKFNNNTNNPIIGQTIKKGQKIQADNLSVKINGK